MHSMICPFISNRESHASQYDTASLSMAHLQGVMTLLLSYRTNVHTGQAEQQNIIQEMLLHRLQDFLYYSALSTSANIHAELSDVFLVPTG